MPTDMLDPDTMTTGLGGGLSPQPPEGQTGGAALNKAVRAPACLDLTLPTPAENLACDEALLDAAEAGQGGEVLRFWEPQEYFVVLGYANRASQEVDLEACRSRGVPVLRRCSGGGAVLQGPGCLNYSVVLRIERSAALASITSTNRFILQRHADTLMNLLAQTTEARGQKAEGGRQRSEPPTAAPLIQVQGFTDLTFGGLKCSGNSQRRRRRYLLFHGTFLLAFDLTLVAALLRFPSRQPAYRQNRSHQDFCTNLGLGANEVKSALQSAWNASQTLESVPLSAINTLAREKYSTTAWNLKGDA